MPDPYNTPYPDASSDRTRPQASTAFRFHRLLPLLALLFLAIALFSFHPEDVDHFAGGLVGSAYPRNLLGHWGTNVSWFLLTALGLAVYPLLLLCLLCSFRRILYRKGLLPSRWDYFLAIPLNGLSISVALGAFPHAFEGLARSLNLAELPGGVIGQLLCMPGTGWISRALSTTGCLLLALVLFAGSLGVIWNYDWRIATDWLWERFCSWLQKRRELAAQESARKEEERLRQQEESARRAAQAPEPEPPQQPSSITFVNDAPQNPANTIFRARRGQESIQAGRQAEEAILGQQSQGRPAPQPAMTRRVQGELPLETPAVRSANAAMPKSVPVVPTSVPPAPAPRPMPAPAPRPAFSSEGSSSGYRIPDPRACFLMKDLSDQQLATAKEIETNKEILQTTLDQFKIDATVTNAIAGPQVTLYEVEIGTGVQLKHLGSLKSNLQMALRSRQNIRMLLPIPGKDRAGIEVPNQKAATVCAGELFTSPAWQNTRGHLPLILGKNITGNVCVADLSEAPHLLIAGTTGSGKSGCMNLLIQSMLLRFTPDELRLIMVDPKLLEFAPYEHLPHLASPIINDVAQVATVLQWACLEMDKRYRQMKAAGVRKLDEFNSRPPEAEEILDVDGDPVPARLPYLVIIIDELADITLQVKKDVDVLLGRLGGKARAAGIHMIVATQRPSTDVITGVIKSNFPFRIALRATDSTNSRIILGTIGAENLLGKGDMLFSTGAAEPERIQCGWVENSEIARVTDAWAAQGAPVYNESLMLAMEARREKLREDAEAAETTLSSLGGGHRGGNGAGGAADNGPVNTGDSEDDLIRAALKVIRKSQRPTISYLQRALRIGYNKSATLVEELADMGYLGPQPISGMREIYWDNFPPDEDEEPELAAQPSSQPQATTPQDDNAFGNPPAVADDDPAATDATVPAASAFATRRAANPAAPNDSDDGAASGESTNAFGGES